MFSINKKYQQMYQLQIISYFQYLVNVLPTFHNYETSFTSKDHLKVLTATTTKYCKKSLGMSTKALDDI